MSKNIVFCADGTWNGPGEADTDPKNAEWTNVFKLFLNLAGAFSPGSTLLEKEQEKTLLSASNTVEQVAKYLHGVGDSDNFLVKLLGGGLGTGLITRIVRGYTFVSRNYRAGDKIFLIGFSRGAYTARALAGLIANRGLLDATKLDLDDKEKAYRLGAAVWYQYRQHAMSASGHGNLLSDLANAILDLPGFFTHPPANNKLIAAPIEAVGVWDTVGALGIPAYTATMVRADLFQFSDTKLSPVVKNGFQAIAVDERRADFTPTFWDPDNRVVQALFPGAHGDVGGGYPRAGNESGLSDRTLEWMTAQLAGVGVLFAGTPTVDIHPDFKGVAHMPWNDPPFLLLPQGPRTFVPGYRLANFVLSRMGAGPVFANPGLAAVAYSPTNLNAYVAGTVAAQGVLLV